MLNQSCDSVLRRVGAASWYSFPDGKGSDEILVNFRSLSKDVLACLSAVDLSFLEPIWQPTLDSSVSASSNETRELRTASESGRPLLNLRRLVPDPLLLTLPMFVWHSRFKNSGIYKTIICILC